jgi:hypothetical protein
MATTYSVQDGNGGKVADGLTRADALRVARHEADHTGWPWFVVSTDPKDPLGPITPVQPHDARPAPPCSKCGGTLVHQVRGVCYDCITAPLIELEQARKRLN